VRHDPRLVRYDALGPERVTCPELRHELVRGGGCVLPRGHDKIRVASGSGGAVAKLRRNDEHVDQFRQFLERRQSNTDAKPLLLDPPLEAVEHGKPGCR